MLLPFAVFVIATIGKEYLNKMVMITYNKTNSENLDFKKLVRELDIDLQAKDDKLHTFYSQYNKIDKIKYVIVAYENKMPVGCGAIKQYSIDTMEVKRMYVPIINRGHGIATKILTDLESWAKELNFKRCILETGKKQTEAIQLYRKNGYLTISNYGQYENIENSLCFEKKLKY